MSEWFWHAAPSPEPAGAAPELPSVPPLPAALSAAPSPVPPFPAELSADPPRTESAGRHPLGGRRLAVFALALALVSALAGGLIGGGLGSLVGGGTGRTVATVVGALGGGFVGNELERNQSQVVFEISVRYDDGTWATIRQNSPTGLRVGDRVVVTDNGIQLLGN